MGAYVHAIKVFIAVCCFLRTEKQEILGGVVSPVVLNHVYVRTQSSAKTELKDFPFPCRLAT